MSQICPKCNSTNGDDNKFCVKCGYTFPMNKHCVRCGAMLPIDSKFCTHCGTQSISTGVKRVPSNPAPSRRESVVPMCSRHPAPGTSPQSPRVPSRQPRGEKSSSGVNKSVIITLSSLLSLAVIGGAIWWYFAMQKENRINNFVEAFAQKVSKNDIDGLKYVYPGIVNADSIALPHQYPKPEIEEAEDGTLTIRYSPEVTVKAVHIEDNKFSVKESRGLFAYPEETIEKAKKLGVWDSAKTDVQQALDLFEAIAQYETLQVEEAKAFAQAMPKIETLLFSKSNDYYLNRLGFEGHIEDMERQFGGPEFYERGTFRLQKGNRICDINVKNGEYGKTISIYIDGDQEVLSKIYDEANKLLNLSHDKVESISVEKIGNEVLVQAIFERPDAFE